MPNYNTGDIVDGWAVGRILGVGGNAEVWSATRDGPAVALKILRPRHKSGSEPYRRFQREVVTLQGLGGRGGVIPILDASLPDHPSRRAPAWVAMPIATPIRDALGEEFSARSCVEAIHGISRTLLGLQAEGISHRDLKPENLYWFEGEWCVGDFGLVSIPDGSDLTAPLANVGSRHYIAPEMQQDASSADGKAADVWSLGKTLWVLIAGYRNPLPGEMRANNDPVRLSLIRSDPSLITIETTVDRCTRIALPERYSMAQLADDLGAWLDPKQPSADPADLSDLVPAVGAAFGAERNEAAVISNAREIAHQATTMLLTALRPLGEAMTSAGLQCSRTGVGDEGDYGIPGEFVIRQFQCFQVGLDPFLRCGVSIAVGRDGMVHIRACHAIDQIPPAHSRMILYQSPAVIRFVMGSPSAWSAAHGAAAALVATLRMAVKEYLKVRSGSGS